MLRVALLLLAGLPSTAWYAVDLSLGETDTYAVQMFTAVDHSYINLEYQVEEHCDVWIICDVLRVRNALGNDCGVQSDRDFSLDDYNPAEVYFASAYDSEQLAACVKVTCDNMFRGCRGKVRQSVRYTLLPYPIPPPFAYPPSPPSAYTAPTPYEVPPPFAYWASPPSAYLESVNQPPSSGSLYAAEDQSSPNSAATIVWIIIIIIRYIMLIICIICVMGYVCCLRQRSKASSNTTAPDSEAPTAPNSKVPTAPKSGTRTNLETSAQCERLSDFGNPSESSTI